MARKKSATDIKDALSSLGMVKAQPKARPKARPKASSPAEPVGHPVTAFRVNPEDERILKELSTYIQNQPGERAPTYTGILRAALRFAKPTAAFYKHYQSAKEEDGRRQRKGKRLLMD